MVDAASRHPGPGETILEPHGPAPDAPAHPHGVELGLTHALDASRQHHVGDTRFNLHASEQDRLQA